MGLTKTQSGGLADDSVNDDKLANSIVSAIAANTAKDLAALSASSLTSGTVPDARFPATLPAVSGANLTGISSAGVNRNLIINGAMLVAQRGTSSTNTSYQTVDRFEMRTSGTDETPTQAQVDITGSSSGAYPLGFRKAYKLTNGNQSTAGSADQLYIRYRIESQDIAQSGWNYVSSSSYVTLSFWVKSSVAQNFYGYLEAQQGTAKMFPFQTGSLSANTWTKVTVTIPGNSDLTFDNGNGIGMGIIIAPFFGTDNTDNSASVNTWKAHSSSSRCPDNTSTWYLINDATFEITGVQLELGQTATDFAHESYADTLLKCKRYFNLLSGGKSGSNIEMLTDAFWWSDNEVDFAYTFPVEMRATPSVYQVTGTGYFKVKGGGADDNINGNFTLQYSSKFSTSQYCSPSSGGNNGKGAHITVHNVNSRYGYQAEI